MFLADLSRAIRTPSRIEFMGISSYGRGKTSSGQVRVTKDLDVSIEGHHVLIVEDIVDSGVTLTYLLNVLEQRRPKSLAIATLLDKPERRLRPVNVAYVGFKIPDEFVVGYGLDFAEDYRNLKDICILAEDVGIGRWGLGVGRSEKRLRLRALLGEWLQSFRDLDVWRLGVELAETCLPHAPRDSRNPRSSD